MNHMTTSQTETPNGWDEDFYLAQNPDVGPAIKAGYISSGYSHFLQFGATENRNFRFNNLSDAPLDWSDQDYLRANDDLTNEISDIKNSNAYFDHWNRIGRFDGRRRTRDLIIEKAQSETSLSHSIVQEMYAQAQFEPSIFPEDYFSSSVSLTNLEWMQYKGKVLRAFVQNLKNSKEKHISKISHLHEVTTSANPLGDDSRYSLAENELEYTHVFLAPWLKTGGADKAAILFANSVASDSSNRVLFLTTEVTDSPWAKRLHPAVTYFDFGNYMGRPGALEVSLSFTEQRELLAAYLLDHAPAKLHVINSHLGWFLLGKYGKALSQVTDLYVSLYCYDYTSELEPVGYARYIRLVAPYLKGIISDNTQFPNELMKNFGLEKNVFSTTWHPAAIGDNVRPFEINPNSPNVLWASRLDRQKRPDILLHIAKACPEIHFHVYGDSVMNDSSAAEFLKKIQRHHNIHYHGAYSTLNDIKRIPYRAFLYTSQWDGLPNILLEFGLLGFPIVTSIVGGISDLIDSSTGYPISKYDEVIEYIDALRKISLDGEQALARAKLLKELVIGRHNESEFKSKLSSFGYMQPKVGENFTSSLKVQKK